MPRPVAAPPALLLHPDAGDSTHDSARRVGRQPDLVAASWESRDDLEVIRLLFHSQPAVSQRAEDELRRRGFGDLHLRLGEYLVHPDPRRRRELADQLTRLTDIDARRWLLWLSRDADADVRLSAISVLLEMTDPVVARHLANVRRTETDTRILRQLEVGQLEGRTSRPP